MATNLVQDGNTANYLAPSAVSSGAVVVAGQLAGVALTNIASGQWGTIALTGVYAIPQGADAFTQGAVVYWDGTEATTTATANDRLGLAHAASDSGASTVNVMLNV